MTPSELDRCPSCQAPHAPEESLCWMCGHKFWTAGASQRRTPELHPAPEPEPRPIPPQFPEKAPPRPFDESSWTQPFLIGAFILVLAGLTLGSGFGSFLLWLGMLPALFVTALIGFNSPTGKSKTGIEKIEWVVTRVASLALLMIVAAAGITIALFITILVICGLHH